MSETKSNKSLIKILSNPILGILGIVGAIASVIGIPLGYYFYAESKQNPQLAYYVHPVKAVVVRVGQASKLTANYEDKRIETDITAAQIALWNQGNVSIRKNNILKPVVLYTENSAPF